MANGPGDSRTALVILGMHRSGASLLAQVSALCGHGLSRDLTDVSRGNFGRLTESSKIAEFNESILNELGSSWENPGPFLLSDSNLRKSERRVATAIARRWTAPAVAFLNESCLAGNAFFVHDPRVALLLPLWRAAFAGAGLKARYILIYRRPLEVAASLHESDRIPLRQALLLWQTYNLSILELESADALDAVVAYDDLLKNPREAVERLFRRLDIRLKPLDAQTSHSLGNLIIPERRHHALSAEALSDAPHCSRQVADTWELLGQWNELQGGQRKAKIKRLRRFFDEAVLFAGSPISIDEKQIAPSADESVVSPSVTAKRAEDNAPEYDHESSGVVVLHYHLFKNAGTSVDEILKHNFGPRWAAEEFRAGGKRSNVAAVATYLRDRPNLLALSSHTALLPTPDLEERKVIPLIFIRHPVDRLRSAYAFERKQEADTLGARLAKENDFAGYLRALLKNPTHRQGRNFQALRLSFNEPPESGSEEDRALKALRSLDFVGLVEAFDKSLERLVDLLRCHFPRFKGINVHKNATHTRKDALDDRLCDLRSEIGVDLYDELMAANDLDLRIFKIVAEGYATA